MPELGELTACLDALLATEPVDGDPAGVWLPGAARVERLGLALEPFPRLAEWVRELRLDSLFLHRPWRLDPAALPPGIAVLAYHRGFDERMSVGNNPHLAARLRLGPPSPFPPLSHPVPGMLGRTGPTPWDDWVAAVRTAFDGLETTIPPTRTDTVRTVAVVAAMTDSLVRAAAAAGADAYLTGQIRRPAARAVLETGIGVVATGHARAEQWGLHSLAGLLRARFRDLSVSVASPA